MSEYAVEGYGVVNPEYDQPYLRGAAFDPKVAFAFAGDPEKQAEHQDNLVKDIEGVDDFIVQAFAKPDASKYLESTHAPGTTPYDHIDPNTTVDEQIQSLEQALTTLKDKKEAEDNDDSDNDSDRSFDSSSDSGNTAKDLVDEDGNPKAVLTNKFNTKDDPIKPGDPTNPANPPGANIEDEKSLATKKAGETALREQRVVNLENPRNEATESNSADEDKSDKSDKSPESKSTSISGPASD